MSRNILSDMSFSSVQDTVYGIYDYGPSLFMSILSVFYARFTC